MYERGDLDSSGDGFAVDGTAQSCANPEEKGRWKEDEKSGEMNHRAEVMSFIFKCFVCVWFFFFVQDYLIQERYCYYNYFML